MQGSQSDRRDLLLEPKYRTAPMADPPPIPYSKLDRAHGVSPILERSSFTDILYPISTVQTQR
jgi:hypothetical protein